MRFEWDEDKNQRNLLKHDIRFETAVLVFDDPFALSQRDESSDDEERWITLGAIGPGAILLVVHTWFERSGQDVVRIISARAATSHERKAYEEAHQGTKKRHRRHRGKKRPGHRFF
jgi:uncharacterized DUF497 family protein